MRIPMVAADIKKWLARGHVTVNGMTGMNNQAGTLYIQFHQTTPQADGTLANGTVPAVKSYQVLANLPFNFQGLGLELSECFIGISSTELSYTAVGADGGLDMSVDADSRFMCDGTEHVVGSFTDGVDSTQIWAAAAGPKKLLQLQVQNLSVENRWFMLFGEDAPDEGAKPIQSFYIAGDDTAINTFDFGTLGFTPQGKTAANVTLKGCTIVISTTATTLTSAASSDSFIKAVYK